MVRDGYYYAGFLLFAAIVLSWLTNLWWATPCVILAAFFLWFFRDPERVVTTAPGAIVSAADGKVTDVSPALVNGQNRTRISIFLNVFDVHVNRSPIAGRIADIRYQRGKFLNAMDETCADQNEQNVVTVEGEGQTIIFKQIAGLLARRIVITKKIGDKVERGERVGLIKFGSRTDVFLDSSAQVQVKKGDRVKGGATVLAYLQPNPEHQLTTAGSAREGGR